MPKGVPGRRQQNLFYLAIGAIIGAIIAGAVVALILPKTAAPSVTEEAAFDAQMAASHTPLDGTPPATVIAPRIGAVAVAPDGKSVAISSSDQAFARLEVHTFRVDNNLSGDIASFGTDIPIFDKLVFSPNGTKLVGVMDYAENVLVYDVATHSKQEAFGGYRSAAFSADGKLLVLGSSNGDIRILDANTLALINTAQLDSYVMAIAVSPDSEHIAAAIYDEAAKTSRIVVINVAHLDAQPVEYGVGVNAYVSDMAYHPSGQVLALTTHTSLGTEGTLRVLNLQQSNQRIFPLGMMGRLRTVQFDPTGNWLAVGGGESSGGILGTVHLWRWDESGILRPDENWLEEVVLRGHDHDVNSLTFMPDGSYLLSASSDGSLRMWDYRKGGTEISRLQI